MSARSSVVSACLVEDACKGGNSSGDMLCAGGSRGPWCEVCADGHFAVAGGLCEECASGIRSAIILPIVLVTVLVIAAVAACVRGCGTQLKAAAGRLSSVNDAKDGDDARDTVVEIIVEGLKGVAADKSRLSGVRFMAWAAASTLLLITGMKLRILISLFQMLTGLAPTFTITYPRIYKDVLNVLGSVNLDFLYLPIDCAVEINFYHSLFIASASTSDRTRDLHCCPPVAAD